MKTKILLALIGVALLSGCLGHGENTNSTITGRTNIYDIDCKHSVICYERGLHVAAFSCVYVPTISECEEYNKVEK